MTAQAVNPVRVARAESLALELERSWAVQPPCSLHSSNGSTNGSGSTAAKRSPHSPTSPASASCAAHTTTAPTA